MTAQKKNALQASIEQMEVSRTDLVALRVAAYKQEQKRALEIARRQADRQQKQVDDITRQLAEENDHLVSLCDVQALSRELTRLLEEPPEIVISFTREAKDTDHPVIRFHLNLGDDTYRSKKYRVSQTIPVPDRILGLEKTLASEQAVLQDRLDAVLHLQRSLSATALEEVRETFHAKLTLASLHNSGTDAGELLQLIGSNQPLSLNR